MKQCIKCKKYKEIEMFSKHFTNKDRLETRCQECISTYNKNRYLNKKEKIINNQKKYREECKNKNTAQLNVDENYLSQLQKCYNCEEIKTLKDYHKDSNRKNGFSNLCKTCQFKRVRIWQKNNKEVVNKRKAKWQHNNLDKHSAREAKRRAKKMQATPKWLTNDQYQEIEHFYSLAKELQWLSEQPLEIDHIIPLQGKNVCGLHVPWNLQILPKNMNCPKNNKMKESIG